MRRHQKLGMLYFGPFQIIKQIGFVAYKHKLYETAHIHLVFHTSLLRKYKANHTIVQAAPAISIDN